MKKQVLFIAIAGLFTAMASAADLYVRDFGAGGSYATISAAITAASNGDRIIIKPKSGGVPYIENLTIDKSLSFVCETNFVKYVVQGSISITPLAGRAVTINNLSLTGNIILTGETLNGRTTVNVFNSTMNSITTQQSNATLNMSGCVVTTIISLTHGRLTANKCAQINVYATVVDSSLATDDIELIANVVTSSGNNTSNSPIIMDQKNYAFKILNNFLTSGALIVSALKTDSNNQIRNNVINTGTASAININLLSGGAGFISVLNNILTTTSTLSSYAEIQNAGGVPMATVYAFYNMSGSTFTTINVTSASNNSASSLAINTTLYTVTGGNLDAGYPEDEYTDTDLTRNDIGNFGGSDSWSNYWPTASNKPQLNYLDTPRRIYTGTTEMNANGAANSK